MARPVAHRRRCCMAGAAVVAPRRARRRAAFAGETGTRGTGLGAPARGRAQAFPATSRTAGSGPLGPFMYNAAVKALVGIIMGSSSDWETLKSAADTLERLGVPFEVRVVSAHRTPDLLFEYAATARDRGLEVIIAGAGGAAHLPGMTASKTSLPWLGVPVQSKTLSGLDSLLSIVQMPTGVPVGTLAIGPAGAVNAALLAAAILGGKYPAVPIAYEGFREKQTARVLDNRQLPSAKCPPDGGAKSDSKTKGERIQRSRLPR